MNTTIETTTRTVSTGWAVAASGSRRGRVARCGSRGCAWCGGRGRRAVTRVRALMFALSLAVALAGMGPRKASAAVYDGAVVWGNAYHIAPAYIERVIDCESGGDTAAYNASSGASGLLQIEFATWVWLVGLLNQDSALAPGLTSYDPENRPMSDPDAQIHVFAWAVNHGYARQWECA